MTSLLSHARRARAWADDTLFPDSVWNERSTSAAQIMVAGLVAVAIGVWLS